MSRDEQMYEQGFDDGVEAGGSRGSFGAFCAWGLVCGFGASALTAICFLTFGG